MLQQASEEDKPTLLKITLSVNQTPIHFFKKLIHHSQEALKVIEALEKQLLLLCPNHIPSFYKIRKVLMEI